MNKKIDAPRASRTGRAASARRRARDPRRDRRDDEQPRQTARSGSRTPRPHRRKNAADDPDPVAPEVHEQAARRADVESDEEREVEALCARTARLTMLCHPNSAGTITECPRLDTGNSSVIPWNSPMTIAWKYERWCMGRPTRYVTEPGGFVDLGDCACATADRDPPREGGAHERPWRPRQAALGPRRRPGAGAPGVDEAGRAARRCACDGRRLGRRAHPRDVRARPLRHRRRHACRRGPVALQRRARRLDR